MAATGELRLRYTRRAQRDISQILTYLEGRSPAGSEHVVASLQASLNFIAEYPLGGKRTRNPTLFVKIVSDYPYKIFYRLRGGAIEIAHVRHAARRPWPA
jgi:plasmid stabilization system protein ParE